MKMQFYIICIHINLISFITYVCIILLIIIFNE